MTVASPQSNSRLPTPEGSTLRRAIRRQKLAYATEDTYVSCICRYARFCHQRLGTSPQDAGISAISPYLHYLALERNVAAATQNQALNAIAIHDGKGGKHRIVPLPRAIETCLQDHLALLRKRYDQDLASGAANVHIPESLLREFPTFLAVFTCQHQASPRPHN